MNNILGIFATGPNPSACLLRQGQVVAMAEEERLVRSRDIELSFPTQAIAHCMQVAGIAARSVDAVAYGWDAVRYPMAFLMRAIRRWLTRNVPLSVHGGDVGDLRYKALINLAEAVFHDRAFVRWRLDSSLAARAFGEPLPPVCYVPHHLAHAASAFYCSGFDEAAILTVDRNGEDVCAAIWEGRGTTIIPRRRYTLPHSLGWFYSGFTDYLGFRPEYQEGHVMGLAAYGEPDAAIARRVAAIAPLATDGSYRVDSTYFYHGASHGHSYTPRMVELFGPPRLSTADPIEQWHKNIAYAVQHHLERAMLGLAGQAVRTTGLRRLCLAGGVALNCVANGKLLESSLVEELFVQPVSNDAGTALGAALWVAARSGADPRFAMRHAFYGPSYTTSDVRTALASSGLAYTGPEDLAAAVALLLADGAVVGWFDGPMEVGPRALGARSIIADPRRANMATRVNSIKGRASWRPLAPAILDWAVPDYCTGAAPTPFMTVATTIRSPARQGIPAVVHVDGTTRPQVVCEKDAPRFWRLITAFHEVTGIPAILNTSFNVAGEPIVCSPQDAIKTFVTSDIDAMALQGFLVWKPSSAAAVQSALQRAGALLTTRREGGG